MGDLIKEHWLISVLGALVIGALGSGLWEVAFKPFFKKLGEIVFYILTLGIKKTRDSVYLDAAKGHKEQGGIYVALHMSGILSAFLISMAFMPFYIVNETSFISKERHKCVQFTDISEYRDCKRLIAKQDIENFAIIFTPLSLLLAVIFIYSSLRLGRIYTISTDFGQYLTICKPYLHPDELAAIEKDFALMKNKSDYENILKNLNKVSQANGLYLPRYEA